MGYGQLIGDGCRPDYETANLGMSARNGTKFCCYFGTLWTNGYIEVLDYEFSMTLVTLRNICYKMCSAFNLSHLHYM